MGLFKKFRKSLDKKQEIIRIHQNQEDFDLYSPDEDVRVKAISKITEHAECLHDLFEDIVEDSEYGDRYDSRYGNRKEYDDDDMFGSRYGGRRGARRM